MSKHVHIRQEHSVKSTSGFLRKDYSPFTGSFQFVFFLPVHLKCPAPSCSQHILGRLASSCLLVMQCMCPTCWTCNKATRQTTIKASDLQNGNLVSAPPFPVWLFQGLGRDFVIPALVIVQGLAKKKKKKSQLLVYLLA